MNQHYLNRYNKFIASLKCQVIEGYSEKHHIVPKSLGGNNDESNIIRLTPRQHYIAHWILWKTYGGPMVTAFNYMNGIKRYGHRLNSRTSEVLKLEENLKQKSKHFSEETRQKMREAKIGKPLPESVKYKLSLAQVGRVYDDAFRQKVSYARRGKGNGRLGKTLSEETKRKIAESNNNRSLVTCPHCNKTLKDHGGAKRWHFDRCKFRK